MPKAIRKTTTAKKTSAPDPIPDLIWNAQRCIYELREASAATAKARAKWPSIDRNPVVVGPDYFLALLRRTHFYSMLDVNGARKAATERWRTEIRKETKEINGGKLSAAEKVVAAGNIACARFNLQLVEQASVWLEQEVNRALARATRIRNQTGYAKLFDRRTLADYEATMAVRAISKAKPTTLEGAIALIKFIADSKKPDAGWIVDLEHEIDIREALYHAHDVVQHFQMVRSSNAAAEMLSAVTAERARRQAARAGRKAA